MRIGFLINDVMNEELPSTTLNLAKRAQEMGHEVWLMDVGDFIYDASDRLLVHARAPKEKKYRDTADYREALVSKEARRERIAAADLDILMLRNDPAADYERPWAQQAGLVFGYAAVKAGVIVLNDPVTLSKAINKMYFQYFPEAVRLKSLISRNEQDIIDFYYANAQKIIIKPLMGSGGRNVFLVQPEDEANIRQMIASVMRDGYIIAQEYFPPASKGDIRFFMVNGKPFRVGHKYAAVKRVGSGKDVRNNIHAGGHAEVAEVTDEILELAEIVRPKLVKDGIFFAGLDIVENRLLEINIFSPGGLGIASRLVHKDYISEMVGILEQKVAYKRYCTGHLDNVEMNTL